MGKIPYRSFAPDDGYAGAAEFYRFRPEYPQAAIDRIVDAHGLDGTGTLLDVGCGTGNVCRRLAGRFASVIAADPSRTMLDEARRRLRAEAIDNVTFLRLRAEEIGPEHGPIRLATCGNAFHRTDRLAVAAVLADVLEPDGALVLLCSTSPWIGDEPWQQAVRDVIARWFASGPPSERHEEVLSRSRLGHVAVEEFVETCVFTETSLLGFFASTSFASPAALGEWTGAFERDLVAAIEPYATDGRHPMRTVTSVITARG